MITATQITQSVFGDDEIVDAAGKVSKPLSKLIDATSGITGPQAVLLSSGFLAVAGLIGYGIHEICGLAKSRVPVDFSLGNIRFAANSPTQRSFE
jgi:hypothetical protein